MDDPGIKDFKSFQGLDATSSNTSAEKPKRRRFRKRSEKQWKRYMEYLEKKCLLREQDINMWINSFDYTKTDDEQVCSSANLPSPAFGIMSPENDISLRDVKSIFDSALAIEYIDRVSTLKATADVFEPRMFPSQNVRRAAHVTAPAGDVHHPKIRSKSPHEQVSKLQVNADVFFSKNIEPTTLPKQTVSGLPLNAAAKPFVPLSFRKSEQLSESRTDGENVPEAEFTVKQEPEGQSSGEQMLEAQSNREQLPEVQSNGERLPEVQSNREQLPEVQSDGEQMREVQSREELVQEAQSGGEHVPEAHFYRSCTSTMLTVKCPRSKANDNLFSILEVHTTRCHHGDIVIIFLLIVLFFILTLVNAIS